MAATSGYWNIYPSGLKGLLNSEISVNDDFYCMLLSSSYTPTISHQNYSDVSAYEIAQANGYTTGGNLLSNVVISEESNLDLFFDCDSPSWLASGGSITARYGCVYCDSSSVNPLISVGLLDETPADVVAIDGKTFRITIAASGIFVAEIANGWT